MKDPKNGQPTENGQPFDAQLSAYLDGEMDERETQDFERLLDSDPALRRQVDALLEMNEWLDRSRGSAPDGFAERVERSINARVAEGLDARPADAGGRSIDLGTGSASALGEWIRSFRWAWAPAAVVAAVALFLMIRADTGQISPESVESTPVTTTESEAPRHEFFLEAGDAGEVCLVGNFNQWTVCETPLERVDTNLWRVDVPLGEGRHEYMFVVDGQWRTDPAASFHVDDGFGNQNAVVYL